MTTSSPGSPSEPVWFKSSYSGGNATECVEAALLPHGLLLRDSKWPAGGRMAVSGEAWGRFLGGVRSIPGDVGK